MLLIDSNRNRAPWNLIKTAVCMHRCVEAKVKLFVSQEQIAAYRSEIAQSFQFLYTFEWYDKFKKLRYFIILTLFHKQGKHIGKKCELPLNFFFRTFVSGEQH